MKLSQRIASLALLLAGGAAMAFAQSTGTITQTVNQRNTLGVLSATPNGTITAGNPIAFTYILNTAGAPAPTTETVQFYDGTTRIGHSPNHWVERGNQLAAILASQHRQRMDCLRDRSDCSLVDCQWPGRQHQYSDRLDICECHFNCPLCGAGNNQLRQSASDLLDLGAVGNSDDTQSDRPGQPFCGRE